MHVQGNLQYGALVVANTARLGAIIAFIRVLGDDDPRFNGVVFPFEIAEVTAFPVFDDI